MPSIREMSPAGSLGLQLAGMAGRRDAVKIHGRPSVLAFGHVPQLMREGYLAMTTTCLIGAI